MTMRVYHKFPSGIWAMFMVNRYEGEVMIARYPQYYSRTSNFIERNEQE